MAEPLSDEQQQELEILRRANASGKIAVPVGGGLSDEQQTALERLQLREWIRLIDVSTIVSGKPNTIYRVFMLTPPALQWMKKYAN